MSESDSPQPQTSAHDVRMIQSPPRTIGGIVRRLGPGLIIAGSIVGSGELIATTKTAAEAGFWLLWLIIVGCVIKVFVQVEFGRFTIAQGLTSMDGMNMLPGPRLRVNWLMWYWLLMFTVGIGQLGGIVGGVGQSLAMTFPISGDFDELLEVQSEQHQFDRQLRERLSAAGLEVPKNLTKLPSAAHIEQREAVERERGGPRAVRPERLEYTYDDVYWSGLITIVTAILLFNGRYGLIQSIATVLVASFTAVTVFNLAALQSNPAWATSWADLRQGFSFRLPISTPDVSPLGTALATFGIIGVGAAELVAYPYWCLEKGYARFTGPREAGAQWVERARGWLRVMRFDAWLSMVVYTFATVAFYLLGAGVLHREGLNPAGAQMIYTLSQMYVPVFGSWARPVFLFGAVAILYSTFFVATAGNTRMATDALRIFRVAAASEDARRWWIRLFSAVFPFLSLTVFAISKDPVRLVLISGLTQAIMLPMLGAAALFFRYRRCDPEIRPGKAWDVFLWVSVAGLLLAGAVGGYNVLAKLVGLPLLG